MPNRPPLTKVQLREIQSRRQGDADVRALLWEIRRLHGLVLRAHQIAAMLPPQTGHVTLHLLLGQQREVAER